MGGWKIKLINTERGREGKGRRRLTGKLPKLAGDIHPGKGRRERGQKEGKEGGRGKEGGSTEGGSREGGEKRELFLCPCAQYIQAAIQDSGRSQARVTSLPVRVSER